LTPKNLGEVALSFREAHSPPHFDRTAFKVEGKRIFTKIEEVNESVNTRYPHYFPANE
jgi:hypothetical protein